MFSVQWHHPLHLLTLVFLPSILLCSSRYNNLSYTMSVFAVCKHDLPTILAKSHLVANTHYRYAVATDMHSGMP